MVEGLPVHGYQSQTEERIALVNANKMAEETLLRLLDMMQTDMSARFDKQWLATARTHFEEGYMALNRAIFRPQRVRIPTDPQPKDAA